MILASGSPRRRELLGQLLGQFEVLSSDADEASPEMDPLRLAAELAQRKARAVASLHPERAVLGVDTVVAVGSHVLGKPRDEAENRAFLEQLSGGTHRVITGVCLLAGGQTYRATEQTQVTFRPLTPAEMAFYAATGEGLDKAGGYGIQGQGAGLVARIEGDYSNVVGLPLTRTLGLLRQGGIKTLWD